MGNYILCSILYSMDEFTETLSYRLALEMKSTSK